MASPGVTYSEKDVSFVVENVTSNAAGYAGLFRWGPVEQDMSVSSENDIVLKYGRPDKSTSLFFHSAKNYLDYVSPLRLIRVATRKARNAYFVASKDGVSQEADGIVIKNDNDYDTLDMTGFPVVARYPGSIANGLVVEFCDSRGFDKWEHAKRFSLPPQEGQYNVVIIDEEGSFTGRPGNVLERFEQVSMEEGDKHPDGTSAYLPKVLKLQSNTILVGDTVGLTTELTNMKNGVFSITLKNGVDGNDVKDADFSSALTIMKNKETFSVTRGFTSGWPTAIARQMTDVFEKREDAIAFYAPPLESILSNPNAQKQILEYYNSTLNLNTSYAFLVDNWKLVYDKYNDENIWIPCDSDAAGLHGRVFAINEPWFSPAGINRGQLKNVIKLAWYPGNDIRDDLYTSSINSIVAFAGEGYVLFGDKTSMKANSAFSRINVRSLLIVLKIAIGKYARTQLFETNDIYTQTSFRNSADSYLTTVKSRRGLYDKKVVCDSTNNTPQVIDNNEFVCSIYLKPSRTINNIRLNFIAVATGVSFEEIEGI